MSRFALERKHACKGPLGNNFGELGEVLDCLLFVFIFVLFCTALQVCPYDTKLPPNRTAKKYTTGQKTVMLTTAAIIQKYSKSNNVNEIYKAPKVCENFILSIYDKKKNIINN